jgi:hypothetical protein
MDEFSVRLRGEELRREAEAWRRLHGAARGHDSRRGPQRMMDRLTGRQRKIASR